MFDAGREQAQCVFHLQLKMVGEAAEAGGLALKGGEVAGVGAEPGEGIGRGGPILVEALSERVDVVEFDADEGAPGVERLQGGMGAAGLGLFGEAECCGGEMRRQIEFGAAQTVGAGVLGDLGLALRRTRTRGAARVLAIGFEAGRGELRVGHG
ncbi:MAG: hypothetical protein HY821_12145 [Acidobacteria bacterium]|nr:hypothetical protein [Acidobacteriota bacterium]